MNEISEIARNFPQCNEWDESSLVGQLHEQRIWSHDEYWKLERALYATHNDAKSADENLLLFCIFSFVIRSLGWHFDANNLFKIENLSSEEIYSYQERVTLVFEGVFKRKMPNPNIFDINNPLMTGIWF